MQPSPSPFFAQLSLMLMSANVPSKSKMYVCKFCNTANDTSFCILLMALVFNLINDFKIILFNNFIKLCFCKEPFRIHYAITAIGAEDFQPPFEFVVCFVYLICSMHCPECLVDV